MEGVDVGASAANNQSTEAYVETNLTLNPTNNPRTSDDLVWFPHEPLWRELADASLESSSTAFDFEVRSTADYGVDVSSKAMIGKSGLDIGGESVKRRTTVWRMSGMFV